MYLIKLMYLIVTLLHTSILLLTITLLMKISSEIYRLYAIESMPSPPSSPPSSPPHRIPYRLPHRSLSIIRDYSYDLSSQDKDFNKDICILYVYIHYNDHYHFDSTFPQLYLTSYLFVTS